MNDQPSYTGEADEEYFSSGMFQHGGSDAHSSHADALHADALGRDITSRDTARTEIDSDEAYQVEGANSELDYPAPHYAPPYPQESQHVEASKTATKGYERQEDDILYNSHLLINSTYFNIANRLDDSVAGLVVLMDNGGQAVRSELHLYEDISEAEKQEAIRQANLLIKDQFSSQKNQSDNQMLELRIFDTKQKYATLYVDLPYRALATQSLNTNLRRWWPLAAAALAVLFGLLILGWLLSNLIGGDGLTQTGDETPGETSTAIESTGGAVELDPDKPILNINAPQGEAVQEQVVQGQVVQGQPAEGEEVIQGEVVQGQPAEGGVNAQNADLQRAPAQPEWVDPSLEQTNGLPTSIHADPSINRSSRVRVLPGIQIMLRSHPGPSVGTQKGVMQDGEEAIVVGGSYWTEGERDTIVWWYVRLDDGTEAWVAANTSDLTLLEPIY